MARKYLTPIDMNQNEVQNLRLQQLGSAPGSPVEGQLWYNTTNHRPQWRDNSANNDIYPFATASTANTGVLRDGSGNFSAGTITANLTGTASQATTLDDGTTTYRSGSYYLNFANSTGTRTHTAISDFDTQVRTSRLDQMAAPTASVSFNSQNITNVLDPVNPQDAATKNYVDANSQGLDVKASVRVATTASLPAYTRTSNVITATSNGALSAIDGVTLVLNDRLLLKNGAAGADNGLYYVSQVGDGTHPYTLTRTTDADTSAKVTAGLFTFVEEGTTNGDTGWVLTTNNPITLNTTSLTFTQFSGAGTYTGGNGITITGTSIAANLAARLTFTSSQIDLASGIVTPGTYTSVTVDTYGRTTAGADIITSNGGVYRTAAGTFTARTITGTANRITVTNGDGVSGAPTIDIHASYVGQSTITTLGTIATGTWQGTTVGVTYGGTGVNGSTAANGTLLIGNGSGYTLTTLTAGTNISITNGSGSITINTTSTVLTGTGVSGQVAVWNGTQSETGFTTFTYASATGLVISSGTTPLALTQSAASSGSPNALSLAAGAHTTLAASTEAADVLLSLARTVQFATGALTSQRAVKITAPTYAFVGSSTLTTAATVAISGAPVQGTNATITNAYALWVESGNVQFAGNLNVTGTETVGGLLTLNTASANLVVTQGVATSGSPAAITYTGAAHTTLTASTEASDVVYNHARTVQFATGTITTQRAFRIMAPTYAFVASSTITTAATFAISGAPATGTNASFTNAYALWVQGGTSRFDGDSSHNDATNFVFGTTTGTKIGTSSSQKLAFYNATPVVQQTGDISTALSTLGLVTSGTLAGSSITGTVGVANGGTGLSGASAANGTLLIGNGTGYTLATLTAGTGISITNGAGSITINATGGGTVNKFATSIGNGSLTTFTVTHSLGTLDVLVVIYDNSTLAEVEADVVHTSTSVVTITVAGTAPTTNAYRVVVIG